MCSYSDLSTKFSWLINDSFEDIVIREETASDCGSCETSIYSHKSTASQQRFAVDRSTDEVYEHRTKFVKQHRNTINITR